ncbi:uncharacterized protein HMPREF1541_04393 [Cyphellophora europaea CBS 101466]|uniref:Heterokaryon incompatibility domain-containing protein n=1 Tax=Cyphellophora europaea (strain CBS 101466) TaxID=1220924 RepID=W2RWG8_CYPE1|nr:uncharacterized protein HMPREF1541_04393 [Cyphellophora europaea CBS 101466]ETN40118.1 hypothetical protein HMPREF1541_04393 [Cyphellophora europaea CBS 101466]
MALKNAIYAPLPLDTHIHLLTIRPGHGQDTLFASIGSCFLSESTSNYTAISYVWGAPAVIASITIEQRMVPLTESAS